VEKLLSNPCSDVEEFEIKCPQCDGNGYDNKGFICNKCIGEGKLDWIENIVGKLRNYNSSALDRVNVRRLISYIEKSISDHISQNYLDSAIDDKAINNIKNDIGYQLDNLKNRRALYDYKVESHGYKQIDVFINPTRSVEMVKINYEIMRR